MARFLILSFVTHRMTSELDYFNHFLFFLREIILQQMEFYQGNIYHVYNRGNNSQPIFFEIENYLFFLKKMRHHLLSHCNILAWCLMPNHFHWMVQIKKNSETELVTELNKEIGTLLRSYTRAINNKYDKTGSLFQPKTKAKNLNPSETDDNNYPLICFLYTHQNPFRAGLVSQIGHWKFFSFRDYAYKRSGTLCSKEAAQELLSLPKNRDEFRRLSQKTIPDRFINRIF